LETRVRSAWIIVAILAIAPAVVRAEPPPRRTMGVGFVLPMEGIGDGFVVGAGGAVSHAWGLGKLALALEGSLARVWFERGDDGDTGDTGFDLRGFLGRAGVEARLTPGSAQSKGGPERFLACEMRLDAGVGVESFAWDRGGTLTRPEGWIGFGLQTRQVLASGRQIVATLEMRLTLARAWSERATVRTTGTTAAPRSVDTGLDVLVEVEWGQ
jgi:hypothetical protein